MNVITHRCDNYDIEEVKNEVKQRILQVQNDQDRNEQMLIYEQLCEFEFGRWLLANRGLNAYWSHYLIHFEEYYEGDIESQLHELEKEMLLKSPGVVAAKEIDSLRSQKLQNLLKNDLTLASVPCGLMNDLLRLDIKDYKGIKLVGIDADYNAIHLAKSNAFKHANESITTFINEDAWKLNIHNEFDVLCSAGLNMYVKEESKLLELYKKFYDAIKPEGCLLITSNTPPSDQEGHVFWNMNLIDMAEVRRQKVIYNDVIQVRQGLYPNENEIVQQLKSVGFNQVNIIHESRKMFPLFQAFK